MIGKLGTATIVYIVYVFLVEAMHILRGREPHSFKFKGTQIKLLHRKITYFFQFQNISALNLIADFEFNGLIQLI